MEQDLWQYLKTVKKPIVLYGMGNGADKIIKVLHQNGIEISGIFASDGFVKRKEVHGFNLSTYDELRATFGEMIILVSFGSSRTEVIENIKRYSKEQEVYAPDVPVYGEGLFTNQYLKEHSKEFELVFSRLADPISRKTYENIINFKLSGKVDYLFNCEVCPSEPFNSFLKLTNSESFLDLGAYNGDTVEDFVNRVEDYSFITAVEPDPKTFKKLCQNTEKYKNINCINAFVSEKTGKTMFSAKNGRGSNKSGGDTEIDMLSVDDIFKTKTATFINIDIEGEELNAIKGMKNAILQHKPKILLAGYHRTEDLISLPLAIENIRDDYKIYIRHFRSVPAWDTNFYFV